MDSSDVTQFGPLSCLPRHVAIIMDGNGRWAQNQGLSRLQGHGQGALAAYDIIRAASRRNIPYLTLYAFSQQNWLRPTEEVDHLMGLIEQYLARYHQEIMQANIRFRVIGDAAALPLPVRQRMESLIHQSQHNTGLQLSIALSYGARRDMVCAVKALLFAGIQPEEVDENALRKALSTGSIPDPDLIIRTGGEHRLSDFLLFEAAYAELCFLQTLWPDFTEAELDVALADFSRRDRRFGEIKDETR